MPVINRKTVIKMNTKLLSAYQAAINLESNTMKSTDLHSLVYNETGKFALLGDFHVKVKQVLDIVDDGKTPPSQKLSNPPTLDNRGYVSYYNLDEVECNMIMASVDVRHLRLIATIFVKVKCGFVPPPPKPKTRLELAKEQVVLIEIIERKEQEIKELEEEVTIVAEVAQEMAIEVNRNREWASVKFVESKFHIKVDWRIVKQWNTHLGKELKHIGDQNYGKVRTYHRDAWKSAYNLDI